MYSQPAQVHILYAYTRLSYRKLIFGMQPSFDPTRKTTLKKMEDDLKIKIKMEDDLKTNENGRRPQFFYEKLEWRSQKEKRPKKNERRPKKKKNDL